jgi:hypothetical protein
VEVIGTFALLLKETRKFFHFLGGKRTTRGKRTKKRGEKKGKTVDPMLEGLERDTKAAHHVKVFQGQVDRVQMGLFRSPY